MLEHSIRHTAPITAHESAPKDFLAQIEARVDKLHSLSRQGLWQITAFLLVSIAALACRDIRILEHLSENTRVFLGAPPAPYLIHIVLAVSTLSGLIIIAGRLFNDAEPGRKWEQFFYRSIFYLFYFFSNALNENFLVVFVAGIIVLTLEHYHIWTHCRKAIQQEKETMRKLALWPLAASNWRN